MQRPTAAHFYLYKIYLSMDYMADQAANSVGQSHPSYEFDGSHCALAIDAATPVASYRPDLLEKLGVDVPQSWADLLALARRGAVAMPGISIDTLMNFYMLCSTQGQDPFVDDEWAVSEAMGIQVLEQLRELASLCNPEIFNWNPIAVYEALSHRDDLAYCPFAYGYSNYSRSGYSDNLLIFTDMVAMDGNRCRSTLGGTGLAISSSCRPFRNCPGICRIHSQSADAANDFLRVVAGSRVTAQLGKVKR